MGIGSLRAGVSISETGIDDPLLGANLSTYVMFIRAAPDV